MIDNLINYLKIWIRKNRKEAILITIILVIGAFFRLYRIGEYMIFLGDEGRDAIVMRRLLVNFDPILIGPGTSIGNMYLGPLYYYLMAPGLLFTNLSPVGPSILVALFGIATIFLVWFVGREWFGRIAGLASAFLYAVSPVVITFAKSSWNPNIMPFFALLSVYGISRVWRHKEYKWILVLGVLFAIVLQSHYLGLLLLPVLALFWLLTYLDIRNSKSVANRKLGVKKFLRNSFWGLIIFAGLMSPLLIFDFRHNWINFNAVKVFFTQRETTVSVLPWKSIPELPVIFNDSISSLLGAKNKDLTWLFANGIWFFTLWIMVAELFSKRKIVLNNKKYWVYIWDKISNSNLTGFFIVAVWLLTACVGLALYKQHIYDHYYGFFFTAPFILVGAITQYILDNFKSYWKVILIIFFGYALAVNLTASPLKQSPNRQMQRAIDVARLIQKEADRTKFNLAVIAERNYEDGYQYFLERWGEPVIDIDPLKLNETLADQLFVVCEIPKEKCDPTHSPKAEIANFGWSKIAGEWDVDGLTVYKLTHSK